MFDASRHWLYAFLKSPDPAYSWKTGGFGEIDEGLQWSRFWSETAPENVFHIFVFHIITLITIKLFPKMIHFRKSLRKKTFIDKSMGDVRGGLVVERLWNIVSKQIIRCF